MGIYTMWLECQHSNCPLHNVNSLLITQQFAKSTFLSSLSSTLEGLAWPLYFRPAPLVEAAGAFMT